MRYGKALFPRALYRSGNEKMKGKTLPISGFGPCLFES